MNKEITPEFLPPATKELETDLAYVRQNQYDIIEKGIQGLEHIAQVAEQSQHPRAYEVLATYLKTLSDLNKDLIETSTKKNEKKISSQEPASGVTNQLFVGSTAQLAEMLKQARAKDD
jgi:Terminase DNA packaging enzyme